MLHICLSLLSLPAPKRATRAETESLEGAWSGGDGGGLCWCRISRWYWSALPPLQVCPCTPYYVIFLLSILAWYFCGSIHIFFLSPSVNHPGFYLTPLSALASAHSRHKAHSVSEPHSTRSSGFFHPSHNSMILGPMPCAAAPHHKSMEWVSIKRGTWKTRTHLQLVPDW